MTLRRGSFLLLCLSLGARGAAGQEASGPELAPDVALSAVEFYNRPGTTRLVRESTLAAGEEIVGDVAVLGGNYTVAGRIRGDLLVINGELELRAGAEISGAVLVVGGSIVGNAPIGGTIRTYPEPLRYRMDADRLVYTGSPPSTVFAAGHQFRFGRTDIALAVRRGYNRVEGLPIALGPRLDLGRANPTRLEGFVIYRSAPGLGLDHDRVGYVVRAEQFLGGRSVARFGVHLFSEIVPVEETGLSDRENSLSTFILHQDFRDHYERRGWGAYLRLARRGLPYDLVLDYRDERDRSIAASAAWAILDNGDAWRPQPLVGEGTLRTVALRLGYDTRNDVIAPAAGWLVRGALERGLGGSPASDAALVDGTVLLAQAPVPVNADFTAASVDVRRYARLGPSSRMAMRFLASGSLDGKPLPPQRQQTLGGEGTLPGYRAFGFDCGARRETVEVGRTRFFPFYGCDRLILVQLEYQAGFPLVRGLGRRLGFRGDLGESLGWTAFFDTGRAWTDLAATEGRSRGAEFFAADVGIGLRIERIGLYWGLPLSGRGQGFNFFVRIGPRL